MCSQKLRIPYIKLYPIIKTAAVILFLFPLISCENKENKTTPQINTEIEKTQAQQQSVQNEKQENQKQENHLIRNDGVDIFVLEGQIPLEAAGYAIKKSFAERSAENIDFEIPVYRFYSRESELLDITPVFDYMKGQHTNAIEEIILISDTYKTSKGIGVGSTIEEFAGKYPDFKLSYTYESGMYVEDMYVLETGEEKAQFLLDENDFVGDLEFNPQILEMSDFKKNSKIKQVRMD